MACLPYSPPLPLAIEFFIYSQFSFFIALYSCYFFCLCWHVAMETLILFCIFHSLFISLDYIDLIFIPFPNYLSIVTM